MKLVKESLSHVAENSRQHLIESCTPSLEAVEARVANMGSHLDCEVQAQIALKLRDMVKCAIQCAADEFGVANIDAARWLDWVVEDLRIKGCPDECVAQLFTAPDAETKSVDNIEASDTNEQEEQDPEGVSEEQDADESVDESSEEISVKYWKIIYRHPTGVYSQVVAEGNEDEVRSLMETRYNPQSSTLYPITGEEFEALIEEGISSLEAQVEPETPESAEFLERNLGAGEDNDQQGISAAEASLVTEDLGTPESVDFQQFLDDAEVILVEDARTFDINEWEAQNSEEIDEELNIKTAEDSKAPKFIKYRLDDTKVASIVEKLKSSSFNIVDYWKTKQFLKKQGLTKEDLQDTIRSLSKEDYVTNSAPSEGANYNEAVIFIKNGAIIKDLGPFNLYIKLDYDSLESTPVIIISIHQIRESKYPESSSEEPVKSLEEYLNVNVDTDQQNVNVAKDESSVDIKIDSKSCEESDCDAEAELQALAEDPKYAKAFAYLMKTLQSTDTDNLSENDAFLAEDLSKATPYMLRNDGDFQNVSPLHPYIKYGHESVEVAIKALANSRFRSLEWFYKNTNSQDTKQLIGSVVAYLIDKNLVDPVQGEFCSELVDVYHPLDEDVAGFVEELAANTNQEFCRVRTSNLLFRGNSEDIYFRISSIRFNWFDLIWSLVYNYRTNIGTVTICKDSNTFGGKYDPYKIKGTAIDHMRVDEFLTLSGNPVIEDLQSGTEAITEANRLLRAGKLISEAYDSQLHPVHVSSFYTTQVRETLQEDLEHLLSKSSERPLEKVELETEPPKGPEDSYVASVLGTLIKEEYDAIASYTSFLQDLEANNFGDEADERVICDILAEENVHVGQLQELLKKFAPTAENIDVGVEEAKIQIEDAEEVDKDEN